MKYANQFNCAVVRITVLATAITFFAALSSCEAQILNGSFENSRVQFGDGFPSWDESRIGSEPGWAAVANGGYNTDGNQSALLFGVAYNDGSSASVSMSQVFAIDEGDQVAFDFGWAYSDDIGIGNSGSYQIALRRESDLSSVFSFGESYEDKRFVGTSTAFRPFAWNSFQTAPLTGGSYRIEFTSEARGGQSFEVGTAAGVQATFDLTVDNVRIVTSIPEPSGVLVTVVVFATLLVRRRRQQFHSYCPSYCRTVYAENCKIA